MSVEFEEVPMTGVRSGDGVDGAFYRELVYELGEHARRGGTAYGAAVVAKRVALSFGIRSAARVQLPRPNRFERETAADRAYRG